MKKIMKKIVGFVGCALLIGFIFLLYYGHKTACPNVEVYYKCNNFWD
jgi:hypothetical protein